MWSDDKRMDTDKEANTNDTPRTRHAYRPYERLIQNLGEERFEESLSTP